MYFEAHDASWKFLFSPPMLLGTQLCYQPHYNVCLRARRVSVSSTISIRDFNVKVIWNRTKLMQQFCKPVGYLIINKTVNLWQPSWNPIQLPQQKCYDWAQIKHFWTDETFHPTSKTISFALHFSSKTKPISFKKHPAPPPTKTSNSSSQFHLEFYFSQWTNKNNNNKIKCSQSSWVQTCMWLSSQHRCYVMTLYDGTRTAGEYKGKLRISVTEQKLRTGVLCELFYTEDSLQLSGSGSVGSRS